MLAYLLLFCLSFLSATLIPIGSEAHFTYLLTENYNFTSTVVIASIGNSLGSAFTFYLGWIAKWEWIEKYLKIKAKNIATWQLKINKYGLWLATLCWLPIVGDVIAVAMGIVKTKPLPFLILMSLGKIARYFILGIAVAKLL